MRYGALCTRTMVRANVFRNSSRTIRQAALELLAAAAFFRFATKDRSFTSDLFQCVDARDGARGFSLNVPLHSSAIFATVVGNIPHT